MAARVGASILCALVAACGGSAGRARAPVAADGPALVVMSYNVNFGLAGDQAGDAIRAGGADLVVLQETTPAWERAIRAGLADVYPHMIFRHCCGAGGLAFLSRHPLDEREYVSPADEGWFPAWRVVVAAPLGPVQVLAVHLRPPLSTSGSLVSGYFPSQRIRRHEIESYVRLLDREPELPALVVGDFNEEGGGDAVQFLARRGLRTVLADFEPGADTWQWQTSVGPVSRQLDHVVADARLAPLDARVLRLGRSDHYPVVATFVSPP